MKLSSVFKAVVHKRLAAVDLPKKASNQHELSGVAELKALFGTNSSTRKPLTWHYFCDDEEPKQSSDKFTFYDSRAKSFARTRRSEWRFYYYGSFLETASTGDWFFLVRTSDDQILALIFQKDSAWLRAAKVLFAVDRTNKTFDQVATRQLARKEIDLLQRQILAELNLALPLPTKRCDEEMMVARFGLAFPTTKEMSAFARSNIDVDLNNADEALVRWLNREEELFLALERALIRKRLATGFNAVEDFISYSLSVHQRRKSRMGHALQNQLSEIFTQQRIQFAPQAQTEGRRRPDFIFPGKNEYRSLTFNRDLLVMLGAKATCKDRWRQILVEAQRVPKKHLCTLETGISAQQTSEMHQEKVVLVVPSSLHATYTPEQLERILSISDFITFVRRKQNSTRK